MKKRESISENVRILDKQTLKEKGLKNYILYNLMNG